jgi:transcriptional regulator with XRE-family HTH domain
MKRIQEAEAIELHRQGKSVRQIATAMGVSRSSVQRLLSGKPVGGVAPSPYAPVTTSTLPATPEDALTIIRALVAENRTEHLRCAQVGDSQAAQRYARTTAMLLPVLARLEKAVVDDRDMIHVSRRELEEAERLRDERDRIVLSRPLTCERCGAELAVAWAEERDVT